jgi:DNA polymerase-3 subunit delta'
MLRFPELAPADIDAILLREAPQADAAHRAAAIAAGGGSPGAALDFLELDLGAMHQLMGEIARSGDADFSRRGKLAEAMGARPDRKRQLAAIDLARAVIAGQMAQITRGQIGALTQANAELARLTAQAPTYNFDAGLLVMEIGGLLASVAAPRDAGNG